MVLRENSKALRRIDQRCLLKLGSVVPGILGGDLVFADFDVDWAEVLDGF